MISPLLTKAAAARKVLAAALSFVFFIPLPVHAETEFAQTYSVLRNGAPATLHDKAYIQARNRLDARAEAFEKVWANGVTSNSSQRCERYSKVIVGLTKDLRANLEELSQPSKVSERARFHLIASGLFAVHSLFTSGGEGGYSTIDSKDLTKCSYKNRQEITASFDDLARELSYFHLNGVGNPGLYGYDQMISELLQAAQREMDSRKKVSLTMIGAATLASIFLWQVAPPLALKLVGGSTLAIGPWSAFGARSVAFAAESVTYQFAETKLNPSPPERQTNVTTSWGEQMRDLELLSANSLSPDVQIVFLIQVQAQMVQMFRPWLEKNRKELMALPENDAVSLAKEAIEFANTNLTQLPDQLADLIRKDYGYQVGCENSFWSGLSDLQCLEGLRSFARALYAGNMKPLEGYESKLLQINLVSNSSPQVQFTEWIATIQIPYKTKVAQINELTTPTLLNPNFQKLTTTVQRFEAYQENVHLNLGMDLEFEPHISLAQRWHLLRQLEILMRHYPATFDRATEVLFVGYGFQKLQESGMKIRETIPARADWKELKTYLDQSATEATRNGTLENIQLARNQVAELQESLGNQLGVPVQCSPLGNLNSERCKNGLTRLSQFAKLHPNLKVRARGVLMTSPGETTTGQFETKEDPYIVKIRGDFDFASLETFAKRKGWF